MSTTTTEQSATQRRIAQLRAAASLLEQLEGFLEKRSYNAAEAAHPDDWKDLSYISYSYSPYSLDFTCSGPLAALLMADLRREIGGKWDKRTTSYSFTLSRVTEDGLRIDIDSSRDSVCTKKVTGTETKTIPAVQAQPERTEEVEVVEWVCSPLLADE